MAGRINKLNASAIVVIGSVSAGTFLTAIAYISAQQIEHETYPRITLACCAPAMRLAIPEATPSYYLTLSLGVTFPFNVIVGILLYPLCRPPDG